ncbi:mpv17-like protein isoform X1 [Vulpes vulpes]|uniref:Mpv17-like protein isoform X1 n=1 Tax=Vulpes vulpes TaxID=9627 RepID=A0ABM5A539_VULVU
MNIKEITASGPGGCNPCDPVVGQACPALGKIRAWGDGPPYQGRTLLSNTPTKCAAGLLRDPGSRAGATGGMSILQEKDDIFLDLKKKFWNTYKSGLVYWPFVQLTNFSLVPVHWRTAYTGLCGFLWATFLCFSQQSGDGTFKSAFTFLHVKEANALERSPKK